MTSPSQVIGFKGPFCRASQSEGTHCFFKAAPSLPCAPPGGFGERTSRVSGMLPPL